MISRLSAEFLQAYRTLDPEIRAKVKRSYELFITNPRHGSLRFKRIRSRRNTYSARVDDNYRVLGRLDGNVITWYWVGPHDEYERLIS